VPTLIIRGAETDTFLASTAHRVQKVNPAIFQETINQSTHLVALEKPVQVHQKIEWFLRIKLGQPKNP
jgi:pimeloyl-ACP methyl ester carboxylesterase